MRLARFPECGLNGIGICVCVGGCNFHQGAWNQTWFLSKLAATELLESKITSFTDSYRGKAKPDLEKVPWYRPPGAVNLKKQGHVCMFPPPTYTQCQGSS